MDPGVKRNFLNNILKLIFHLMLVNEGSIQHPSSFNTLDKLVKHSHFTSTKGNKRTKNLKE